MTIDRLVLALAGIFIVVSLLLAWTVSPWWLLFTAFVGLNMFQASLTGFCPLATPLNRPALPPRAAFR